MEIRPATLHCEIRYGDDDYKYELRCEESNSSKKKPFTISSQVEQFTGESNQDMLMSLMIKLQSSIDKVEEKIKDRWGKGSHKFQLVLSAAGLNIVQGDMIFMTIREGVSAGNQSGIICGDHTTKYYHVNHCKTFYITPYSENNAL